MTRLRVLTLPQPLADGGGLQPGTRPFVLVLDEIPPDHEPAIVRSLDALDGDAMREVGATGVVCFAGNVSVDIPEVDEPAEPADEQGRHKVATAFRLLDTLRAYGQWWAHRGEDKSPPFPLPGPPEAGELQLCRALTAALEYLPQDGLDAVAAILAEKD